MIHPKNLKVNFPNKYNTTKGYDLPSMKGHFGHRSKACQINAHGACLKRSGSGKCKCDCHKENTQ